MVIHKKNNTPLLFSFRSILNTRVSLLIFFSGLILYSGCINKKNNKRRFQDPSVLNITVHEPVEYDYAEIKKNGVLRMITSYSSGSYFLYRGLQVGFEYELLKKFTRENNLALEVVIMGEDENPYDLLNSGAGDVIAANYTITDERKEIVNFTRPYNIVDQVIVVSDALGFQPESITDMASVPISVRRNSSYYVRLKELIDEGFDLKIELLPEEMNTESLLFQVANGSLTATVADDNIYEASNKYMRGLVKGPIIQENDKIAWAIRKNAPDLEHKLNKFLYKHLKFSEDGTPKRSEFLNVLRKKYYQSGYQIADYFSPDYQNNQFGSISPYDSLIKSIAQEYDLDWILLTAIVAQESKFDPHTESWAGAVGLMQVLPKFSEIPQDSLFIPEVNIREGARIIKENLEHYAYLDSTDRWQMALATYNAGLGHIADARRLVIDQNKNPNKWENVSSALLKLMQRHYYQDARYGFCRGIETVRYVNEITNRYNTYQSVLALYKANTADYSGFLGIKIMNTP